MKKFLFVFVCLILAFSVTSAALERVEFSSVGFDKVYPSFSEVVVVEKDGLAGVVDREGNTVIPFGNYSITLPDSLGRVSVYENGKSTVYDKNGKEIAKFEGYEITSLADDVAVMKTPAVYIGDGYNVSSVKYFDLKTKKVIYESDNVVVATPFCDGYASLLKKGAALIIDAQGKEVYTDSAYLVPVGCPSDGKAVFEHIDEHGDITLFLIDIEAKKRICAAGNEVESETDFTKTSGEIENVGGFHLFRDNDNREVIVLDGIFAPIIEDPVYFNLDWLIIRNGEKKNLIDKITHFSFGEKYLYNGDTEFGTYYDLDGNEIKTDYEIVTGFSDGRSVVYDEDDNLVFIDENLEVASEKFSETLKVCLLGDVFCGIKRENMKEKYYLITLSSDSLPSKPSSPSVDTSGMKNFVKVSTYNDSVFPDVKTKDWFVKNVALAYETGLMNGKGDGFAPYDKLTVAQVITMAARLNSIYETGKAEFVQGSVWYQVYVDYCVKKGIIGKNDFSDYNRNTTRAEFVRILSRAIPESEFELKNKVSAVPDVSVSDKDYKSVLMFYRSGILSGSDSAHNFKPESDITRAETAAIITRIIDKTLRVSFEIK